MRQQRLATATLGIAYIVLSFAGLALAPLADLGSSLPHDRAYLASRQTAPFTAGGVLILVAYLALLAFTVQMAHLTSPRSAAPARALTTAGATLALACVAAGLGLAGAVVMHRAALPTSVAATLLDAASLATWIATLGIALSFAAIGWSVIRTAALPRWIGWTALAIAAAFAACLPAAGTGAAHLPAIAADLWILAATAALLSRRARPATRPATEPAATLTSS